MSISKRICRILLLTVCASLLTSCSSPEKEKQVLFSNALEYIEKSDNESAILELRSAIQLDPKFGEARYQLGLLYLKEGETQKAYEELIRAADLLPDNLDAHCRVAFFNLLAGKKEECRKHLDHVFSKNPQYREALTLLANLELSEKNHDKALAALKETGDDLETSDDLQILKGRIHADQKQWGDAEIAFKKAIAISGEKISHYKALLLLYEMQGEQEKSKQLLDKIAGQFPEDPKTHLLLAGYFGKNNDLDKVEAELQKVIVIDPKNPGYRLQLADFFKRRGKNDNAEETLIQARDDFDKSPDVAAALVTFYFDGGKFEEAKKFHDELMKDYPGYGGTKLLQARFLLKEGKIQDALPILQGLNKDFPQLPEPFFYLGVAQYKLGQIDFAQQAVASAIQKNGNKSEYHEFLAQLHLEKNSFEDARSEASIALRLNPKNVRAALFLSRALIGTKEWDKAIQILTDMNKQIPGNTEILGNLAFASLKAGDSKKGEQYLNELLDIDHGHIQAIALLIGLKYKDDLSGAESFIHQQLKKAPDDPRLYFLLGGLMEKQKRGEEALAAYKKAQELAPENNDFLLASAKLLMEKGANKEAMGHFSKMIEKDPKSIPGNMGVAAMYHFEGEPKKAIEHYEKVLEIEEDFAPAANNMAWLIASDPGGDLGKALMFAMKAKQAMPDDPNVADTLGWVHYNRGSYPLAIAQFEFALQNRPDNPMYAYHLALAQSGAVQKEAAVQTLKTLLARDVEFAERKKAEELLGELMKR